MALSDLDATNGKGIHVGGPIDPQEYLADGAVTPGAIVINGTNDQDAKEATAGTENPLGYALENHGAGKQFRDDHADNAQFRVNNQAGARFMGIILASSAALVHGDYLKTAAGGKLEKWVTGTDSVAKIVARYWGKADLTPGGSDAYALCRYGRL